MSKTAIVILSDPKSGSDEALGRAFNALAAAYDFKTKAEEVKIIFQGAGTRWPEQLQRPEHPAYELYQAVADKIEGVSSGCADVFGGDPSGLELIHDNQVPGTSGLPSFVNLKNDGFDVLVF
ncbi:MAG: DsrE family protein [Williamsia sp.]|nr:DsrE family protein [Williamsia sp.]